MDKNFLKKNRYTIIVIVCFIFFFIVGVKTINIFFPNTGTPVYGDRLDDIVPISDETKSNLVEKLKEENKTVTEVSTSVSGKIFNILITIDDTVSLSAAKKIGETVTSYLDETTIKDYDIQVYMLKSATSENDFPQIAYKKAGIESFSWTKDRDKVETSTGDEE